MSLFATITVLLFPSLFVIGMGSILLRKAFMRQSLLPEEITLAVSFIFLEGSLFWLGLYLSGSTFLGFTSPWTWLAAVHFAFAGFGALFITSLCCRVVTNRRSLLILRCLLVVHPIAYLLTAAGIVGYPYCDEISSLTYEALFLFQWLAVFHGKPYRLKSFPLAMILVALAIPVLTLIPAISWAWQRPLLDMDKMIYLHGIVNAIGHVGLGLFALAIGRPPSHSPLNASKALHINQRETV